MKLAVCALILNDDGLVLGCSRRNEPDNMGLPGGKVDDDEKPWNAICREVQEETGLTILSAREEFRRDCEGPDTYDAICYRVTRFEDSIGHWPREVEKNITVRWITWDELCDDKNSFAPYNKALRAKYEASLNEE